MSETGAPGEATVQPPKTEAQKGPEKTAARNVAEKILGKKTKEVRDKVETGSRTPVDQLPPGEKAVYASDLLQGGLGEGTYPEELPVKDLNADPRDDLLTIPAADGNGTIDVSAIVGETTDTNGDLIYVCKTPTGGTENVPADTLIASHLDQNAADIADLFPGKQADLMEWHAKGGEGDLDVSNDDLATMDVQDAAPKEQKDTLTSVDSFIAQQIDAIQAEIDQFAEDDKSLRKNQLTVLLRDLKIATFMKGDVGIFFKKDALEKLGRQRTAEGTAGTTVSAAVDQQLATIRDSGALETAEYALENFLSEKLPDNDAGTKIFEELGEKMDKGGALAVLQDKNVASLEGINELMFGDENMTAKIANDLIGNPAVDSTIKDRLRGALDKYGKVTGMSLLAILLGLPAAALMATTSAIGQH